MSEFEQQPRQAPNKTGVLSIAIKDKAVLYAAYMSFLQEGGLFIPTSKAFQAGEKLSLLITMLDEPEKFPVTAQVVWITPQSAQGTKAPGIGVQFSGVQGKRLSDKIKELLAVNLHSPNPTHTM